MRDLKREEIGFFETYSRDNRQQLILAAEPAEIIVLGARREFKIKHLRSALHLFEVKGV